ncbi:cupin domain-containing protein [Virgibacillus ihumii]|uniref:cupin domain-containing protein n=1 Tax=Virgibacillus ihumii TaxID=2686091 RepID=UPI00157D2638|nr:cupin domain-containing protein [Virgibacillus ihumii]
MEIKKDGFDRKGLITLYEDNEARSSVQFGTVVIAPGERVPNEGCSQHAENEYSIIIKGELEGESGGVPYKVSASNSTFIPAGEKHWAINTGEQPCEIVWTLVRK